MAEFYRFFDSTEGDIREYTSSQFAEYFSKFLSDGVYAENGLMGLKVSINGFNITVSKGSAFIKGYLYINDTDLSMTIDGADNILSRIDRIVLELDIVNRKINLQVKKGTMGSQPQVPSLVDNASIKEIPIAQIRINDKAVNGIVTDERVPVSSLIEIPLAEMEGIFNSWLDESRDRLDDLVASKLTGNDVTFTDRATEGDYLGVKYKMVVVNGQPYMEVVSNG